MHTYIDHGEVDRGDVPDGEAGVVLQTLLLLGTEVHELVDDNTQFLSCCVGQQQGAVSRLPGAVHVEVCNSDKVQRL